MIAGWPAAAWALLIASVAVGLVIELRFYLSQRDGRGDERESRGR